MRKMLELLVKGTEIERNQYVANIYESLATGRITPDVATLSDDDLTKEALVYLLWKSVQPIKATDVNLRDMVFGK